LGPTAERSVQGATNAPRKGRGAQGEWGGLTMCARGTHTRGVEKGAERDGHTDGGQASRSKRLPSSAKGQGPSKIKRETRKHTY